MELAPEKAGFSAARLERITDHLNRAYIDSGKIAGCQVLVGGVGLGGEFGDAQARLDG